MLKHAITVALGMVAAMASLAHMSGAAITVDIVILMDESNSMSGEQAWIKPTMLTLDGLLVSNGVTGNQYGTVGFSVGSGPGLTRSLPVGGGQFGTVDQLQAVNYSIGGGTEDGWAAIGVANGYSFRPNAARNFILLSDEDRDNAQAGLTYSGVLSSLTTTGTLLNAIVDARFSCGGVAALGIDSHGNGYIANGAGGYTTCSGATVHNGFGTTVADYVNMALATGGAAWDLEVLRSGGVDAQSFTNAFVNIKLGEIQQQPPSGGGGDVPEPGTFVLIGGGLIFLTWRRLTAK